MPEDDTYELTGEDLQIMAMALCYVGLCVSTGAPTEEMKKDAFEYSGKIIPLVQRINAILEAGPNAPQETLQ